MRRRRNTLELLGFTVDPDGSAVLCFLPQLFQGSAFGGFRKLTTSTAPSRLVMVTTGAPRPGGDLNRVQAPR